MEKLEVKLREKAAELLEKGEVSMVIGWGESWSPAKATPVFARGKDAASKLVFNSFCFNNLAVYLPRFAERVAIFTKPCEAGSIVSLLAEGKLSRDNLHIIGVACRGVVDPIKLKTRTGNLEELAGARVEGDFIAAKKNEEEIRLPLTEVVLEKCLNCSGYDENFFDTVIGKANHLQATPTPRVPEDADAAWWRKFWMKEFERCTRCYACREACPACYCRDSCSAQSHREKWTGTKQGPEEAIMFHALRAMHVAGRCIECGACERACPMSIPLTLLHSQVGKAVEKLFSFRVGERADAPPPLQTFKREELERDAS